MGRKALHTQEQVFDAADQLAASGKEVTPTALREALGGGSLTTIYRHLEAWEETRKTLPAPVSIPMPDAVKLAFDQSWQAAATEAGKEIAAIREKADAEIKAANRRLEEAVAAIAQLENEQQADADRLEALETILAGERETSHQAMSDAAARQAGLAATVEQMRNQIEGLKGDLSAARREAEAERKRYSSEIDHVRGQLSQAQIKIEEISTRERAKIEEAARARAETAGLVEALAEVKKRSGEIVNKLTTNKQAIAAELSETRKEARTLSEKLGKASGTADALRAQVAEQQATIRHLSVRREPGGEETGAGEKKK
ncbi:DNA-binding protein [Nitrosospira sp. NRS527]|uniref:DNA-binding protein n=1 Tax=Nitrosospira sp. NRS527 TaxID=155925 RepID=UPI001AFC272C|nr:DNA-binding protein [Nitrosospira sp. NRS527]BCT69533.1 Chromosome partition protein Smc [Nitrosospira sp. NRS527]